MKQTAVEFLIEQIKSKADNLPTNTKENRMAKGIYVDCLLMARQAKEIEKQQKGYSEKDMKDYALKCVETYLFNVDAISSNLRIPIMENNNKQFEQFKNK